MRSIDLYQFYQLGQVIHPLSEIKDEQLLKDAYYTLWQAGNWLDFLWSNQLVGLKVSRNAVGELLTLVRNLAPAKVEELKMENFGKKLNEIENMFAWRVEQALKAVETNLAAELRVLPTYIVSRKGIYETEYLIDHAEQAFDEDTLRVIPPTSVKDFREAGRCLAFELPTASAFHVMRSTEAVLRKYHRLQKRLPEGHKSPEWAVCVNEIRAAGGNLKVVTVLDHIRDLHRNPTMHPEDFLDIKDALALFDVAKSAIAAMASEIAKLAATIEEEEIEAALNQGLSEEDEETANTSGN